MYRHIYTYTHTLTPTAPPYPTSHPTASLGNLNFDVNIVITTSISIQSGDSPATEPYLVMTLYACRDLEHRSEKTHLSSHHTTPSTASIVSHVSTVLSTLASIQYTCMHYCTNQPTLYILLYKAHITVRCTPGIQPLTVQVQVQYPLIT